MKQNAPAALLATAILLLGVGCSSTSQINSGPTSAQPTPQTINYPAPASASDPITVKLSMLQPSFTLDKAKSYTAVLHTTLGNITIALAAKATPITVNNFVGLANAHFYDNTIFHRVIAGFMIQGGDPKGDGTGGPDYKFDDEPFTGEYTRGTVAMANSGPNTNGSQFFIMHADVALPKNYVIFGHVVQGLDVVDKIATAPVTMSRSGEPSEPVTPVVVKSVTIEEK